MNFGTTARGATIPQARVYTGPEYSCASRMVFRGRPGGARQSGNIGIDAVPGPSSSCTDFHPCPAFQPNGLLPKPMRYHFLIGACRCSALAPDAPSQGASGELAGRCSAAGAAANLARPPIVHETALSPPTHRNDSYMLSTRCVAHHGLKLNLVRYTGWASVHFKGFGSSSKHLETNTNLVCTCFPSPGVPERITDIYPCPVNWVLFG
jgi:hypothetical protein